MMERSKLLADTLGDHVFEWFIRNKRAEWARLQVPGHPVRARPLPAAALMPPAASVRLESGRRESSGIAMEPLLCFPDPPPASVVGRPRPRRLPVAGGQPPRGGRRRRAGGRLVRGGHLQRRGPGRRPSPSAASSANARCPSPRSSWWSHPAQLDELELREDLFDDLCLEPVNPEELTTRLAHLFWRTGRGLRPDLLEHGPLVLNLETYQAAVSGRVLDLTYMEYELLRFLAARPGKVFTRETLLSRVWGYEYYGGARTVDVHVRRLRAKLGEEHAHLIQTVRSVGYRFGQTAWAP